MKMDKALYNRITVAKISEWVLIELQRMLVKKKIKNRGE